MDRLAPEIISNIISYFYHDGNPIDPDDRIAPLAVLCRHWQPHVEAQTFRRLKLDESFRFPILGGALTLTRLCYIRKLVFALPYQKFDFPTPTPLDQWRKTDLSDMIVQILFYQLAKIPVGQEPLLDLELIIPKIGYLRPDVEFTLPDLPELPMVRSLVMNDGSRDAEPSPRAMFYMASKMTRLREFRAILSPPTLRAPYIQQRIELGESLSMLPTSIHNFELSYYQWEHRLDDLLVMQDGEDILTRELRRFTQREGLKDFTFSGCVEPSIFWPPASDASDPQHWPTLKAFVLNIYSVKELTCLRKNQPLSYAKKEKFWVRVSTDGGLLNEFYRAAAKCSACMPKAEYHSIDFNDDWYTSLSFCTVFPEEPCLTLIGKPDLEIEDETAREWRKAAEVRDLVFKVRLGKDEDERYRACEAFKPEEIVEKAEIQEDEVEGSDADESSENESSEDEDSPSNEAIVRRLLEQTRERALVAAAFYPHIPFNPQGG